MSVRYREIDEIILHAYSIIPYIDFPMNPQLVIDKIPNCRMLSYQKFAEINRCSIQEVERICNSRSGCTHYDRKHDRYLILYNEQDGRKNNHGRRRWTKSHELGHVLCRHHAMAAANTLSRNGLCIENGELETEADYFAGMFLAPFPLFRYYGIQSSEDIKREFGLSDTAATNRYRAYRKWLLYENSRWNGQFLELYWNKMNSYT